MRGRRWGKDELPWNASPCLTLDSVELIHPRLRRGCVRDGDFSRLNSNIRGLPSRAILTCIIPLYLTEYFDATFTSFKAFDELENLYC